MASYDIVFKPSVHKDLRALPAPIVAQVIERIESLKDDPLPRSARKLTGSERLYRIRVRDYRIVYEVDTSAMRITVQYVRHRRDAYQAR